MINKLKSVWESVTANIRDITSSAICIIGVLFITQIIASVGTSLGIDLHDIKSFMFAIAKFAFVALCGVGYITHITFRDSLGEHDKNEFMNTWKNVLTPKERFDTFLKISIAGLIAASLVFSIGV